MFLKYFLTGKTVRSAVLLVGLCDSGKTLLFIRVSLNAAAVVSLALNALLCVLNFFKEMLLVLVFAAALREVQTDADIHH